MNPKIDFLSKLPLDIQLYIHRYTPFPIQTKAFGDSLIKPFIAKLQTLLRDHPLSKEKILNYVAKVITSHSFKSLRVNLINHLFNEIFCLKPNILSYNLNQHILKINIIDKSTKKRVHKISIFTYLLSTLGEEKFVRIEICKLALLSKACQKELQSKALRDENLLKLYAMTNSELVFYDNHTDIFVDRNKERVFHIISNNQWKHVEKITLVDFILADNDMPKLLASKTVLDITKCTSRDYKSKESVKATAIVIFLLVTFGLYSPILEFGFAKETLLGLDLKKAIIVGIICYIYKLIAEKSLNDEDQKQILAWQEQLNKQQEQLNKEVDQKNRLT